MAVELAKLQQEYDTITEQIRLYEVKVREIKSQISEHKVRREAEEYQRDLGNFTMGRCNGLLWSDPWGGDQCTYVVGGLKDGELEVRITNLDITIRLYRDSNGKYDV
jgi:hypothetical protein